MPPVITHQSQKTIAQPWAMRMSHEGSVPFSVMRAISLFNVNGEVQSLHLHNSNKPGGYISFQPERGSGRTYRNGSKVKWAFSPSSSLYAVKVLKERYRKAVQHHWVVALQEQHTMHDVFGIETLVGRRLVTVLPAKDRSSVQHSVSDYSSSGDSSDPSRPMPTAEVISLDEPTHDDLSDIDSLPVKERSQSVDYDADESLISPPSADSSAASPTSISGIEPAKIYFAAPKLGDTTLTNVVGVSVVDGVYHYKVAETKSRAERLEMALRLALNTAALHAHDKPQRDMKPDNIMVSPHGHIQAIDFTDDRLTPNYKAPEVRPYKVVDTASLASDIYSMGLILADLFPEEGVEHLNRRSETIFTSEFSHRSQPTGPEGGSPVRQLLNSMLHRDPQHRCDITAVVSRISAELADELAIKPPREIDARRFSATQAALIPEAYEFYKTIVKHKTALRHEVNDLPVDQADEAVVAEKTAQIKMTHRVAVDVYEAMQNVNGNGLTPSFFDDVSHCLTGVSQADLAQRADHLSRVSSAQNAFQPLVRQLTSEIARLSKGSAKKVEKGQVTIDRLKRLKAAVNEFMNSGPSATIVLAQKTDFMGEYGDIAIKHTHRDSIHPCKTKTWNNFKKFQKKHQPPQKPKPQTASPFAAFALEGHEKTGDASFDALIGVSEEQSDFLTN